KGELPTDHTSEWLSMAQSYADMGDWNNAANAHSVVLDQFLTLLSVRPKELARAKNRMGDAAAALATALERVEFAERSDRTALLRRLALALSVLGKPQEAKSRLREALTNVQADVADAKDEFRKNVILLGADDLLGVALRIEFPPQDLFRTTFRALRGFETPELGENTAGCTVRVHTTRVASAVGVSSPLAGPRWRPGTASHELARTLVAFRTLANKDYAEWVKTRTIPRSFSSWNVLLRRLVGQLGLEGVGAAIGDARRLVLELDGTSLHLPVAGLIVQATSALKAVAVTTILPVEAPNTLPVPNTDDALVAINCFARSDPLHEAFRQLVIATGPAEYVDCSRGEDFRRALERPARLVLIGAHGDQSGVTGALSLAVGGANVPVVSLLDDLRLPRASTIFCLTCFAGSGFLTSSGHWSSLPGILMAAGARTVVANRWPAWDEAQTHADMRGLLSELRSSASQPDAWPAAEAVTSYVRKCHAKYGDPRQWAGWAAWSLLRWLPQHE
ncbi:MAG TPA: hypothetical protein VGC79_26685, partial [Polyangiaceae bacterium]